MNETFINEQTNHPDNHWLIKTRGWKLAGTLSFANRLLDVQHRDLKNFFALYNYHLDGEYNWKNVPVYWRKEYDKNERLHCHFALMSYTPDFYWLRGSENSFVNAGELQDWFTKNWKHGKSYFEIQKGEGWLSYITKKNSLMDSCFSPPIHFLKREVLAGRNGFYNPRLNPENYVGGTMDYPTDLPKKPKKGGAQ